MELPDVIKDHRGWDEDDEVRYIPFVPSGEIEQKNLVEVLVTEVDDRVVKFIVLDVLDGLEDVMEGRGNLYAHTADYGLPWFRRFARNYRWLTGIAETDWGDDDIPIRPDTIEIDAFNDLISAGDTIHIHSNIYWGNEEGNSKTGIWRFEACRLPVENRDVQQFVNDSAKRKAKLARLMARSMARREFLDMQKQTRIEPGLPYRPFEDSSEDSESVRILKHGTQQWLIARGAYGSGPVKDHYVDIIARPAGDYLTELGGQRNCTVEGTALLTPNITPFGDGSPEDPLYEIDIEIKSETVLNPAVGEQRVQILIDGKVYDALQSAENSSHMFKRPGHRIAMEGYREHGVKYDTCALTEEQAEALSRRGKKEHRTVMGIVYGAIHEGRDFIAEMKQLDDDAEEKILAQRGMEDDPDNQIIATISDNPLTDSISTGAPLLVPRSMLDAIEVNFLAIE